MSFNRCRLMTSNAALDAASVTVSPAPDAGYPASNLQDPDRSKLCRTTGASAEYTFSVPTSPWVQVLALTGLDYSPTAQIRLRGNDEDAGWTAPKYDSGYQPAYPASFPRGSSPKGRYGKGGYLTPAVAPYYRAIFCWWLPELHARKFWKVNLSDPDSTTGKIGIGVIGLCNMIEMTRNFINPWSLKSVDTTAMIETADGGVKPGRMGTRYRVAEMEFENIPDEDKYFIDLELTNLGKSTPWFIAMHSNDAGADSPFTTLYGTTDFYSGMKDRGPDQNDFKLVFREMTGDLQ